MLALDFEHSRSAVAFSPVSETRNATTKDAKDAKVRKREYYWKSVISPIDQSKTLSLGFEAAKKAIK